MGKGLGATDARAVLSGRHSRPGGIPTYVRLSLSRLGAGEKYSMSLMLLNAMAVCQMQMGKFRCD